MKRLVLAALLVCVAACGDTMYRVRLSANEGSAVVSLPAEQYVAAVLAGESSTFRSDEAMQAMAVTARTYAAHLRGRHAAEGFDFCSTTHCQRVVLHAVNQRMTDAVSRTRNMLLWYRSEPVFAAYTRDCGGRAEAGESVWPNVRAPYLQVHDDPYCTRHGTSEWQWPTTPDALHQALQDAGLHSPRVLENVAVTKYSVSGRPQLLLLSGPNQSIPISASSFRFAVGRELGWTGLRSDWFSAESRAAQIVFHGRGQGHGVGMCQRGADQMGLEGFGWREILAFYFPQTTVSVLATDMKWTQVQLGRIRLFTVGEPNHNELLTMSQHVLAEYGRRFHWQAPESIDLYCYPSLTAFRNGTGEPGWVAAHTVGSTIALQPVALLREKGIGESTIRHEVLHVMVEANARRELPLWFREGLVSYLSDGPPRSSIVVNNLDEALAQRTDASRARQAELASAVTIQQLVGAYGIEAVVRWLSVGIPEAVLQARHSSDAQASR